jgi:hypothetical protein
LIRFKALAHYTEDHLVFLSHAKALEAAARRPAAALPAAKGFFAYWENVVVDYINEMQAVVVPRLAEVSLQGRFNKLTAELREATDGMRVFLLEGPMVAPFLPRVAAALHAYVQYAEGHMLPDLQNNMDDKGLNQVAALSLAHRKRHRPGSVGEPRTEKTYLVNVP